jgi:hypothetical protein
MLSQQSNGRRSIASLKALQAERGLRDTHLVSLDDDGFTIAHTDAERTSGMDLTECPLHDWLLRGPLASEGDWLAVPYEHDTIQEDYRPDGCPWNFKPIPDATTAS